jgi:hypothetical protein
VKQLHKDTEKLDDGKVFGENIMEVQSWKHHSIFLGVASHQFVLFGKSPMVGYFFF